MRILLVKDAVDPAGAVCSCLRAKAFVVDVVGRIDEARSALPTARFDAPRALVAPAPAAARRGLVATLVAGAVLTMVQAMRGAHFVRHSLRTAWCGCLPGVLLVQALRRQPMRRARA